MVYLFLVRCVMLSVASKRVSFVFHAFHTRLLLQLILYAYDTLVRQDNVFCGAHGSWQRRAPLATITMHSSAWSCQQLFSTCHSPVAQ